MKAVVDTNVFIFDYVEDSEFHKEAERILDLLERWVIPPLVVHELVWFLRKNGLDSRVNDVISYLDHEKAELSEDNSKVLRKGLEIISREKLSLSHYNDVIILSHSIINGLPLVSFDKDLMKLAKKYNVKTLS